MTGPAAFPIMVEKPPRSPIDPANHLDFGILSLWDLISRHIRMAIPPMTRMAKQTVETLVRNVFTHQGGSNNTCKSPGEQAENMLPHWHGGDTR